jgi:endonuclease/exonuclease/phosphatase family metal-dependent hydrolase
MYYGGQFLFEGDDQMDTTFMSFNLRCDIAEDGEHNWKLRYKHIARFIEQSQALVIGTQEGLPAMLNDLAREVTNYKWLGESRSDPSWNEYCAIFYNFHKLAVVQQGTFWLSETPDVAGSRSWGTSCPRICTYAQLKWVTQPNHSFRVFNVHLDHISELARENGIRVVLEQIKKMNQVHELPTILMGDFNTEPHHVPIETVMQDATFADQARDIDWDGMGKTYHAFQGGTTGKPIDYIFTSQHFLNPKIHIHRDQVEGRYLSDHYPMSLVTDLCHYFSSCPNS